VQVASKQHADNGARQSFGTSFINLSSSQPSPQIVAALNELKAASFNCAPDSVCRPEALAPATQPSI
jgi:hypothetical protein